MMRTGKGMLALLGTLMLVAILGSPALGADWPTRPVQVFVWASAGGDTDLMNRTIWGIVEQQTGKTMNVSNATGALGGLAATRVWDARRDGHTVLGASEMMHPLPVMGAHHTSSKDWDIFTIAGGSGIISVRPDSPYKTFEEFAAAAQKNPGTITISHCPPGCIWHVKALLVGQYAGINWKFVPYEGSQKAITALLTNEVDAVSSSIGEQFEFIRSGKIRPLITTERDALVMSELSLNLRPARQVLPAVEKAPEVYQWLGTAIPSETPKAIRDAWAAAVTKAFASDKMQEVIKRRVMRPIGWAPPESKVKLGEADRTYMWVLHDLKLTTKSPEAFSIPRP